MSFNRPEKNAEWAKTEKYPFELWSDEDKALALAFGAVSTRLSPFPSRVTRVLDAAGEVVLEYSDGIDVGTHPQDVLDDCKLLFGPQAQP